MQNMMPQLDLPSKMIQQQPGTSQSPRKKDKAGGRADDFRDLLRDPSKRETPKEKEPSGSDPMNKADGQQTLETQDGRIEKPDTVGKKEESADESVLPDLGMQALQFLYMGDLHLEENQTVPVMGEAVTGVQPETVESQSPLVQPLQGALEESGASIGEDPGILSVASTEGAVRPEQNKKEPDTAKVKVPVETVKKGDTEEHVPQLQSGSLKEDQHLGENGSAQKEKNVEENGKIEVNARSQIQERDAVQQTRVAREPDQQLEKDVEGLGTEDHAEDPSVQTFAAGTALRQDPLQGSLQKMAGTVPVVHVRAESPQQLMDQLMDQLKAKMALKDQEFEIWLHPENLGKLAIKVAYTAEKVSVSIVCSNEKTMGLLSSGAKNIAQIMEENLGTPTTVVVDQKESDYLEQYNDQGGRRQQQQQEKQKEKAPEDEQQDFLQQLRLGLI